jgi:hypothetical protein
MRRVLVLGACLAATFVPAAGALAQSDDGTLPDGNSAVDQYVDPLPDSDGNRPLGHTPDDAGGPKRPANSGGVGDVPLPLPTQSKLASEGADGYRVAGIVRDTSPREAFPGHGADRTGPARGEVDTPASTDVLVGSAGGMGGWLPFAFAAVALCAALAAVLSRRSAE